MNEADFAAWLALGYEPLAVEFKGTGSRGDKHFLARVIRAVLGMANQRDGGRVILGVDDGGVPSGMEPSDLESWRSYDEVAAAINGYATPSVRFGLEVFPYEGKDFVCLHVAEFEDIPILCSRDQNSQDGRSMVLRRGACYVRSRHKPETAKSPRPRRCASCSTWPWRRVSVSIWSGRRVGLVITMSNPLPASDEVHYKEQPRGLAVSQVCESPVLDKIEQRGYWR